MKNLKVKSVRLIFLTFLILDTSHLSEAIKA